MISICHDVIIYGEQQLWGGQGVRKEDTMWTRSIQIAKGYYDDGVDDDDSHDDDGAGDDGVYDNNSHEDDGAGDDIVDDDGAGDDGVNDDAKDDDDDGEKATFFLSATVLLLSIRPKKCFERWSWC